MYLGFTGPPYQIMLFANRFDISRLLVWCIYKPLTYNISVVNVAFHAEVNPPSP